VADDSDLFIAPFDETVAQRSIAVLRPRDGTDDTLRGDRDHIAKTPRDGHHRTDQHFGPKCFDGI